MKELTISSEILLNGLEPLTVIIQDKHLIPILDCVHVFIDGKNIEFTGSNSEIMCTNVIPFLHSETIKFCVNYLLLTTILKNIDTQDILLTIDDILLKIKHSKGDFELPVFEAADYCFIPTKELKHAAKINGEQLKSSLSVANRFILNSELEPMSNVSITVDKENTVIRSTNKVTLFKENIDGKGDEISLLLSPVSSVGLASLIGDKDIDVHYDTSKIHIIDDEKTIVIVQQQGKYPVKAFDQIIKSIDNSTEILLDNEEFKIGLKRSSLLADSQHNNLVKFQIANGILKMICDNKAFSTKSEEKIGCEIVEEKIVGYNSRFLIEILSVFDSDVKLSFNERNFLCFTSGNKKGIISNCKV